HLARITDALGNTEAVEEFQDLDRKPAAGSSGVAVLCCGEHAVGACFCNLRRGGGERRKRRARVKAVGWYSQWIAAPALPVEGVLECRILEPERGRKLGDGRRCRPT